MVEKIPKGMVATYGQIAHILGRPKVARLVGRAMSHCPAGLPWHRVVKADGSFAGGGDYQHRKQLLVQEDVAFTKSGKVVLEKHMISTRDFRLNTNVGGNSENI